MNWTCPDCGARKEDFEMIQLDFDFGGSDGAEKSWLFRVRLPWH